MAQIRKLAAYIACGALGLWLCARLLPVALPFLLGWLLSRLAEPFTRRMARRTGRGLAAFLCVSCLYVLLGSALFFLGRWALEALERLGRRLPGLLASLSEPLEQLEQRLLGLAGRLPESLAPAAAEWIGRFFDGGSGLADSLSARLLSLAGQLLTAVPELLLFLLTTLLSGYLFSSEQETVARAWKRLLPQAWRERLQGLLRRLRQTLRAYLRAQLCLSLLSLGLLALGLLALGQNALLALPIALVDALPVFGVGTVLLPWAAFSLILGRSSLALGLLLLYGAASLLRQILEPRFLGRQMGIHPLLTLVALYAGFRLFGILGLLLLPVGVVLVKQLYDLNSSAQ